MKVLTPIKGWRVFAGEVGVIVFGVLLALAAQQAVSDIQTRRDVRAFRQTIEREMGYNLYALDLRASQISCDERKLAEMTAWLERSRTGASMPAIYPAGPLTSSPYWGAWNSRDAETYRQLPASVRQKYAMFYDGVENNNFGTTKQNGYWTELLRYSEPGPLSLDERRSVRTMIEGLRAFLVVDRPNIAAEHQLADDLGIKPVAPQDIPHEMVLASMGCRSVLAPLSQP